MIAGYCHVCSIEYHSSMGDTLCPRCGRELEKERRGNRTYRVLMTL